MYIPALVFVTLVMYSAIVTSLACASAPCAMGRCIRHAACCVVGCLMRVWARVWDKDSTAAGQYHEPILSTGIPATQVPE